MVYIGMTAMVAGLMAEVDENKFAPSLQRSVGGTGTLVRSAPFWGPLFDLTGNYGLGVSPVLVMLTLTRPVTEKWEESSCSVGRILCSKLGSRGIGVSTPLRRRTD